MSRVVGTRLTCQECGHSHVVRGGVGEGHLAACLACETDDPGFDRETVREGSS